MQFCLQHTRIVLRKRIDFALKYSYELFDQMKKDKMKKAMIFFVSGHSGDEKKYYKRKLINLNKKLSEQYKTNKFFLIFAEDYKTNLNFEEYPIVFARLSGIATYFSEIEGFGNNLLEVLSGGLIPVVYTYPVFVKDISKYKFNVVCLDKFEITPESIKQMIDLIKKENKRIKLADKNIEILRRKFPHRIFSAKLKRAIIRRRMHI